MTGDETVTPHNSYPDAEQFLATLGDYECLDAEEAAAVLDKEHDRRLVVSRRVHLSGLLTHTSLDSGQHCGPVVSVARG
ncbi:hypothetical protein, partial [Streptomyces rhizosphaericus]|uniref:hypothetical protein n=1 Tax=Streptomyces rhizosphaericus TaxID=114699 RepID=UPI0031D17143